MAHFAKLDENNIVVEVHVVHNNELLDENGNESEAKGIQFLKDWSGGHENWKQTSYNTIGGVHIYGGTPFRKNYAGVGYTYDSQRDAFISPKPYPSWILNEETCAWEAPFPHEKTGQNWLWDEENQKWYLPEMPKVESAT